MFEKLYIYKSTIKSTYGLTDKMINELGEPDKLVPNPYYKSGPPASLYLIERVEEWVENHQSELKIAAERRIIKSKISKEIASKKREETLNWAKNVKINVKPFVNLQKQANYYFDAYNDVGLNGVLAYGRHNLTNYDELLLNLAGKIGHIEAYIIIKNRVNSILSAKISM